MHLMLWKDLMNKTSVTTYNNILLLQDISPAILMNTIQAIHRDQWVEEGGAAVSCEFHQQSDWKPRSDARDTDIFFFYPPNDLPVRWRGPSGNVTDAHSTRAMAGECPRCFPIEQGTEGQKPRKQPCLAQVCSISAQYQSHSEDRWGVLLQQPSMPGEMTSWSLPDFFTQCWSRSILPA